MERFYLNPIVQEAARLAEMAHEGQKRAEGTPYFTHCQEVARILYEEWGIADSEILSAGFLHDTVEDTSVTKADLKRNFGREVAELVDGVSKFGSDDKENIRKVFDKNLIDPRVGVIKLADRLHNMRTLHFMTEAKRTAKAKETEGYASFAESLGMWKVKSELEDLSLKFTNPEEFERLSQMLSEDKRISVLTMSHMTSVLQSLAERIGIGVRIEPRINSLARIGHKMDKGMDISEINDVVSYRVTVDDSEGVDAGRNDCYKMLGIVREKFAGIEDHERFDDFFSTPQDNRYSSIQVTLTTEDGSVEIAIATKEKEDFNNWGVVSLIRKGVKNLSDYALKLIFTPADQVKFFPPGATGIDFAYSIDKEINKKETMGTRATAILIDGVRHELSTVIPNGTTVDVILGKSKTIIPGEYLKFCLPKTRKIIERQIAGQIQREQIRAGKEIVDGSVTEKGIASLSQLLEEDDSAQKLVDWLYDIECKGHLNTLYFKVATGRISKEELDDHLKSFFNNS